MVTNLSGFGMRGNTNIPEHDPSNLENIVRPATETPVLRKKTGGDNQNESNPDQENVEKKPQPRVYKGLMAGTLESFDNMLSNKIAESKTMFHKVVKDAINESLPKFEAIAQDTSNRVVIGLSSAAAIIAAPQLLALGGAAATAGGIAAFGLGALGLGTALFMPKPKKKDTSNTFRRGKVGSVHVDNGLSKGKGKKEVSDGGAGTEGNHVGGKGDTAPSVADGTNTPVNEPQNSEGHSKETRTWGEYAWSFIPTFKKADKGADAGAEEEKLSEIGDANKGTVLDDGEKPEVTDTTSKKNGGILTPILGQNPLIFVPIKAAVRYVFGTSKEADGDVAPKPINEDKEPAARPVQGRSPSGRATSTHVIPKKA